MISLYLTVAIVALMIAYAGIEGTLRVFAWLDLQIRYIPLRIKIELMKRKLKKELDRDMKLFMKDFND
jgi:hypothetical protein